MGEIRENCRVRTNIPHIYHRAWEVAKKLRKVRCVRANLRVGGTAVKELLVRVKQPLLVQQILVVEVVEDGGSDGVEGREIVVATGLWALGL
ncbi:hypothetical protein ACMD2_21901 [Ananas comosus]|uniref:Uncharacterized protein n=1 Tax=Ananas comosus TaxID=4615 RepID=A0A199V4F3_ANACO|nr:hypothetical protein ACMD2_21901 [Ananas comosus]